METSGDPGATPGRSTNFYNMDNLWFMQLAINEAKDGIESRHGGPFGALIVDKEGKILGSGHNQVLRLNDPTAHGEIMAIRSACKNTRSYDLSECTLYTTGEPCTMCLCACLWANISKVYYGCSLSENALIGFRDEKFDQLFSRDKLPSDYLEQICHEECLELFKDYIKMPHKIY